MQEKDAGVQISLTNHHIFLDILNTQTAFLPILIKSPFRSLGVMTCPP